MTDMKGSTSSNPDFHAPHKEWDDTSCPICMDHPHNAVLLLCSSHEKGCRSYICDTSYRHSNCLDRFKKRRADSIDSVSQPIPSAVENSDIMPEPFSRGRRIRRNLLEIQEDYNFEENNDGIATRLFERLEENNNNQDEDEHMEARGEGMINHGESSFLNLKCPLCRGSILGWMIVQEARRYLDLKTRSCSRESCSFSGNYRELRRHARRVHPTTRPADVDPSRQRAWRSLENQQEYGDIISAVRSVMPGAIVMGDYVIDSGDGLLRGREVAGEGGGQWWTTFFLFHMIGSPIRSPDEPRSSSRTTWRRHRRSSGGHRSLLGENLLGLQNDDGDGNPDDDFTMPRRRRRRFMGSRADEEQP